MSECKNICVIDTETNYDDEVISIGAAIVDARTYDVIDKLYLIVYPECLEPAMFSNELKIPGIKVNLKDSRNNCIKELKTFLKEYKIKDIFAYNARFDHNHLPELAKYNWYDIMRIAAYKQYNPSLIGHGQFCTTGKFKTGYGVENVLKILRKKHKLKAYKEIHNAVNDAIDEAEVMKLLEHDIDTYKIAKIN